MMYQKIPDAPGFSIKAIFVVLIVTLLQSSVA